MLTLRAPELPQFERLCPGFKALTMPAVRASTSKRGAITKGTSSICLLNECHEMPLTDEPLKFAMHWVRIIAHMLLQDAGPASDSKAAWRAATAAKSQRTLLAKFNTLDWAQHVILEESMATANASDDEEEQSSPPSPPSPMRKLLLACKANHGDSRTIANAAAQRGWRQSWGEEHQLRAEVVRRASKLPGGVRAAHLEGWEPSVTSLVRLHDDDS